MKKPIIVLGICAVGVALIVWSIPSNQPMPADTSHSRETEATVYETDAESADDCTSYEKYDPSRSVCTYECSSDDECAQIEQSIDDELAGIYSDYAQSRSGSQDDEPIDSSSPTKQSEYRVASDETIQLATGSEGTDDGAIWDQIKALSPDAFTAEYIGTYQVYDAPDDDTMAFVDDEDGDGKFRIAVNLPQHKSSSRDEQIMTLVHELGHILTLNKSQTSTTSEACSHYETDEGCYGVGTLMGDFAARYWSRDLRDRAAQDPSLVYRESDFVTEYAASSPEEDIAESYATYVVKPQVTPTTLAETKVAHFAQYPAAVAMRESMRQAISSSIVRARKGK